MSGVISTAQGRGELSEEIDCTETAAQLAAPILTQHVLLRTTCSDEQIAETISQFLLTGETTGSSP